MEVRKATLNDLSQLAVLFDAYRQFYKQPTDLAGATAFLEERLLNRESVIFMAVHEGHVAGFTQLYPLFSSVSMQRQWLLNDLFVAPAFRGQGVGEMLIDAAKGWARASGAKGLQLETQEDNLTAQRLYNRAGFEKEVGFYHYAWKA